MPSHQRPQSCLLLLVLSLSAPLAKCQAASELRQVYILLGEAPRAPLALYPTDPFNATYWARFGGLGQITPAGLLASYRFGQYLKNLYTPFLTPAYKPSNVYARSVDQDQSLQALNAFMAGMYPPANSDQLWSPSVSWFPVPVHTNEQRTDRVFREPCPKHASIVQESLNSLANFQTEFDQRMYVQQISGKTGLANLNYYNLSQVLDSGRSKLFNNLMLEEWLRAEWANLTKAGADRLRIDYGSLEKARLKSGGLLYDIAENMRARIEANSGKEVFVYSCVRPLLIILSLLF